MPIWNFDFTGRGRIIKGRPITIEKQLTEFVDHRFAQRQALTLARYEDTGDPIMLKIRYDLPPESFGITDIEETRERALDHFLEEVRLVEEVQEIGHGPAYIDHARQPAGPIFPYPGGNAYFIVMSRVPGEDVGRIYRQLSNDQLGGIRTQPAYILEHMRQCEFVLFEQDPSFLRFDRTTNKVYIVDFTYMDFTDPSSPNSWRITENHMYALAFDIWRWDGPQPLVEGRSEP